MNTAVALVESIFDDVELGDGGGGDGPDVDEFAILLVYHLSTLVKRRGELIAAALKRDLVAAIELASGEQIGEDDVWPVDAPPTPANDGGSDVFHPAS